MHAPGDVAAYRVRFSLREMLGSFDIIVVGMDSCIGIVMGIGIVGERGKGKGPRGEQVARMAVARGEDAACGCTVWQGSRVKGHFAPRLRSTEQEIGEWKRRPDEM